MIVERLVPADGNDMIYDVAGARLDPYRPQIPLRKALDCSIGEDMTGATREKNAIGQRPLSLKLAPVNLCDVHASTPPRLATIAIVRAESDSDEAPG